MVSCGLGLLSALLLCRLGEPSITPENAASFGYWALIVHFTVMAICLALFRKRDQKSFVFASATLVHEASRSFSAFENAACYLNNYLPKLITSYRLADGEKEVCDQALDELLELPSQLEQAAQRTRRVVKMLSFTSNANKANFQEFNIDLSITQAVNDPSIKNKISKILRIINLGVLTIKGDFDQITQVFINLLENAHHATRDKPGSIIEIAIMKDCVLVKDTGEGIDKYDIANIFDQYFSTKSTSGQGLAFCKQIMTDHGGIISCSSIKGALTEFRLSFPNLKEG